MNASRLARLIERGAVLITDGAETVYVLRLLASALDSAREAPDAEQTHTECDYLSALSRQCAERANAIDDTL